MSSSILVTGGTGTLGRLVVPLLQDAGGKVRVLSRRSREAAEGIEFVSGDLATGEGIEAAVEGAEIIVHCAGSSKGDEEKAAAVYRGVDAIQPEEIADCILFALTRPWHVNVDEIVVKARDQSSGGRILRGA